MLASRSPRCRGVPAVGPFPSMHSTASVKDSTGRKYSFKSTSMSAKARFCGNLAWYSGLVRPGIVPKRFLTAPVIPIMPWDLSLEKLMRTSQEESHPVQVKVRMDCALEKAASFTEKSRFRATPSRTRGSSPQVR